MKYLNKYLSNNKGEFIYLFSQYSTPFISLFTNILIMKYVSPEILGNYQSVTLYASYFAFFQLGVFNGLNRNLAFYKGSNEEQKLKNARNTGFTFSLIVSFFSLIIVFVLFEIKLKDNSYISFLAFLALASLVFFQPLITFFNSLYRTGQDFKKLGVITFSENLIYGVSLTLIAFFGYVGLVFQTILKNILSFYFRFRGKYSLLKLNLSFNSLKEQIFTGFPLMINGYIYTTFFIFDQFYIANNFSQVELGYFNLARMVLYILPIIPTSLNTLFYPKLSLAYGQNPNNLVLRKFYFKILTINFLVLSVVIVIIYFTLEPIVKLFLPGYEAGIDYAKISVFGGIGFILSGPSVILGVLKKHTINFILLSLLSILTYGFYFFEIYKFQDIISLLWYKNMIFILYSITILLYIYKLIKKEKLK